MNKLKNYNHKILHSAMDLFEILPEGILCQIIQNAIHVLPQLEIIHQQTNAAIFTQIMTELRKTKKGKCLTIPLDVYLDENNVFLPDILYISNGNLGIIKNDKINGAPDLIVEILSPKTATQDKIIKRKIYEKHGVKEYFLVNPKNKELIAYFLKNKKFEKQETRPGKLKSKLLKKTFTF